MAKAKEVVQEPEEQEEKQSFTTPTEIALATGVDPKRVRAYLRVKYPRALELKNSRWEIPNDVAAEVIAHFESGEDLVEDLEDVEVG